MRKGCQSKRAAAFTLLELLIAVAVFALVLGAINTVFYSALKLRNKSSEVIDKSLPLEQSLRIIKKDLMNIMPPEGVFGGQLQSIPTTNAILATMNGPVFYCASGMVDELTPFGDVQKVSYALLEGTNRFAGMDLVRMVSRNLLASVSEEPVSQWLMSGVQQISFFYYDGSQWQESWDSSTADPKLPKGIKMQIQLAQDEQYSNRRMPDPIEIVIPIIVQAATNQTEVSSSGEI